MAKKTPAPTQGGAREGAGRPRLGKKRKGSPAFIGLTVSEKAQLKREARALNLTLSYYMRQRLGLPIEVPAE